MDGLPYTKQHYTIYTITYLTRNRMYVDAAKLGLPCHQTVRALLPYDGYKVINPLLVTHELSRLNLALCSHFISCIRKSEKREPIYIFRHVKHFINRNYYEISRKYTQNYTGLFKMIVI